MSRLKRSWRSSRQRLLQARPEVPLEVSRRLSDKPCPAIIFSPQPLKRRHPILKMQRIRQIMVIGAHQTEEMRSPLTRPSSADATTSIWKAFVRHGSSSVHRSTATLISKTYNRPIGTACGSRIRRQRIPTSAGVWSSARWTFS